MDNNFKSLEAMPSSVCLPIPTSETNTRIFLCQYALQSTVAVEAAPICRLRLADYVEYVPFCDDFGPFNLSSIATFVKLLECKINVDPPSVIILGIEAGRRALTNALFLAGAFMILKLKLTPDMVSKHFSKVNPLSIEPFRDATFCVSDFHLTLLDCWRGLERAIKLGWFALPDPSEPWRWGRYDMDEYKHYQDPLNGDMHEVVPGKFIAFRGPVDLHGCHYRDSRGGYREFSPEYYIDILQERGVTAVIRLNEPCYTGKVFWDSGIAHYDLEFDDCTAPPKHIVDLFFAICDGAPGAVAVHCKAGLGRTGTLVALYLMRTCGFTAREAIAWLRIARPGSVIGKQQRYLCACAAAAGRRASEVSGGGCAQPQGDELRRLGLSDCQDRSSSCRCTQAEDAASGNDTEESDTCQLQLKLIAAVGGQDVADAFMQATSVCGDSDKHANLNRHNTGSPDAASARSPTPSMSGSEPQACHCQCSNLEWTALFGAESEVEDSDQVASEVPCGEFQVGGDGSAILAAQVASAMRRRAAAIARDAALMNQLQLQV